MFGITYAYDQSVLIESRHTAGGEILPLSLQFYLFRPMKKESNMDVETEVDQVLRSEEECPHCNGMGKLNKPGAPECPLCKGTGVADPFLHRYPRNEAQKKAVKDRINRYLG